MHVAICHRLIMLIIYYLEIVRSKIDLFFIHDFSKLKLDFFEYPISTIEYWIARNLQKEKMKR